VAAASGLTLALPFVALGHGEPQWQTLEAQGIMTLAASANAFVVSPFLPDRLRSARRVQRASDHLRIDRDGDGFCETVADGVGEGRTLWYVVLKRASRVENIPEVGQAQVDEVYMDWKGDGRPSFMLTGHTPLNRVKTVWFLLQVDLDDNGAYDLTIEMKPPAGFFWVVSYRYEDAAVREDFTQQVDRWRRFADGMIRDFYAAEYFFHHGADAGRSYLPGNCR